MAEHHFSHLPNPTTLGEFRASVQSLQQTEQRHGSACVGSKGRGKGALPLDNSPVCKFTPKGKQSPPPKQFLLVYLDEAFIALSNKEQDAIAVYTEETLPRENRPCNYIFVKWENLSSGHAPQVAQGTGHIAEVPNIVSIEVTLPIHEPTFSRGHVIVCVCVGNTFSMTTVSCRKKKSNADYPGYAFAQRLTEDEFNRHVPQQQPTLSLTTPQWPGHPLGGSYANDKHPEDMDFSEHISSPSEGGMNDRTMSRDLSPEVTMRRKRLADDQDPCVNNLVVLYHLEANNLTIHGKFCQLSDARYKTEIRSLADIVPDILERLKQIDPKVYKLATAPEIGDTCGVLAQEVEKVLPFAVVTQPDGTKTIAMDSLIAIMIEAIKQLTSMFERSHATGNPKPLPIFAVATNDGLDYGVPVAQTAPAPAPEALSPPNLDGLYENNVPHQPAQAVRILPFWKSDPYAKRSDVGSMGHLLATFTAAASALTSCFDNKNAWQNTLNVISFAYAKLLGRERAEIAALTFDQFVDLLEHSPWPACSVSYLVTYLWEMGDKPIDTHQPRLSLCNTIYTVSGIARQKGAPQNVTYACYKFNLTIPEATHAVTACWCMYELERWRDNGKPPSVIGFYPNTKNSSVTFVVEHGYQSQGWKEICEQFEESSKKALGKEEFSLKVSLSPDTASVSTYFPLPWCVEKSKFLVSLGNAFAVEALDPTSPNALKEYAQMVFTTTHRSFCNALACWAEAQSANEDPAAEPSAPKWSLQRIFQSFWRNTPRPIVRDEKELLALRLVPNTDACLQQSTCAALVAKIFNARYLEKKWLEILGFRSGSLVLVVSVVLDQLEKLVSELIAQASSMFAKLCGRPILFECSIIDTPTRYRSFTEDPAQFMTDLCEEFKIPVPIASCATWVQVAQITYAMCEFEPPDLIDALRKAHPTPEPSETKQQLLQRGSPSKSFENFDRISLLPEDCWTRIFYFLPVFDGLDSVLLTCKAWHNLVFQWKCLSWLIVLGPRLGRRVKHFVNSQERCECIQDLEIDLSDEDLVEFFTNFPMQHVKHISLIRRHPISAYSNSKIDHVSCNIRFPHLYSLFFGSMNVNTALYNLLISSCTPEPTEGSAATSANVASSLHTLSFVDCTLEWSSVLHNIPPISTLEVTRSNITDDAILQLVDAVATLRVFLLRDMHMDRFLQLQTQVQFSNPDAVLVSGHEHIPSLLNLGTTTLPSRPLYRFEEKHSTNLTTFEQDHSAHGGLADRVKLALGVPDTRNKVVNYYSKLVGWPIVRKREAKDAAIDLFEKLSSLEPPSDHLAHLLAALARTGRDGALVQDIEKATGILRRADKKDSANNDGLHYDNAVQPTLVTPPRLISPPTMGIDDAAMPWETFKAFRKNEVAEIVKYLSFDQVPLTRARLIHIHGPSGIGKSTLIKLATKTLQNNYNVVIVLDCRSVSALILSVTRAVEAFGGTCDKVTHQDAFRTLVVDRASLDFRILLIFENDDVGLKLAPYMADKPGLDVIFGSRKPEPSAIDSCEKPKPLPISCLSTDAAQSLFLHEASIDEKQLPEPEKAALRELVTEVLYGYPLSIPILGRIKRDNPQLDLSKLLQHYKVNPDKIEEMAPKDLDDHVLLPQRVFDLLIGSIKDDVFTADASLSACYIFSFLARAISNDLVVKVAETIQAPPPRSQLEPPDWLTPLLSCCICYQHIQDGNSFYIMHPVLQDAFRTRLKRESDDGYKQALKRATSSVFNIAGEGYTRGQWETVAPHVKAIWNAPDSLSILADADIAARFVYLTLLLCTGVLNVEGDSVEKYTAGIKVIVEKHHLLQEEIEMMELMARDSRRTSRHRDACTAMDKAIELYKRVPQAQQDPVKYLGMLRTQSFYLSRTDFGKARKLLDEIKTEAEKLCATDPSTEHLACARDCEINRNVIIGWHYLVHISKDGIRNCEQAYEALDKAERERDINSPTEGPVREAHARQRAKTLLHMVHCRSNTIRYTGSKGESDEALMRRWLQEAKELLLKYSSKGHYYTSNLRLMKARIEISLHNYEKARRLLQNIVDTGRVALTKGTYGELVAVAVLQQDYQEIAKWIDCIRRTVSCFRPDSALLNRLLGVQIHFYRLSQGALSIELRDLFLFQSYLASVEIFCCVDESPPQTEEYLKRYGSYYQESRFLDQILDLRPLDNQPLIDGRLDKVIGFIKDSSATPRDSPTKAKPCFRFQAGSCKHGDHCYYSHQNPASPLVRNRGNDMNKPCFNFQSGDCRYGDKCRYSHSNVSSPATKKKPCKYFSAGDCKRGDKCTFLHDVSSQESEDTSVDEEEYQPIPHTNSPITPKKSNSGS